MNKIVRSYPYPVLRPGSDDYVDVVFNVDCNAVLLPSDKYRLSFTVTNTCSDLCSLIAEGKAVYVVQIECKTTMYRDSKTFSTDSFEFEIPRTDVLNEVIISPLIVSLDDIEDYTSSSFNPDYSGLNVSITMGDRLAIASKIFFDAQPQKEIGKTPESIIRFRKETDENGPDISVSVYSDYIYIKLHEEMLQKVSDLSKIFMMRSGDQTLLWSLFVIPSLVQILGTYFSPNEIENTESALKNYTWFRVIKNKFVDLGIIELDEDTGDILVEEGEFQNISANPFEYAEMLIGNPLNESVKSLFDLMGSTEIEIETGEVQ